MTQEQLDTSLIKFCKLGHLEIVKYLIEKGANVNVYDNCSLRWAAANGYLEVVKYLVDKGANVYSEYSYVALLAMMKGHLEVVKYLESLGCEL